MSATQCTINIQHFLFSCSVLFFLSGVRCCWILRCLRYHFLPYILDVGRKKTVKVTLFPTFTLSLSCLLFSYEPRNLDTIGRLRYGAMYHCAPGIRRLRTNSISIDRRWIRPRLCYFTLPLPSPRPFIHDRQLDNDKKKKEEAGRMEGLSPLSLGRKFCLAAVAGS